MGRLSLYQQSLLVISRISRRLGAWRSNLSKILWSRPEISNPKKLRATLFHTIVARAVIALFLSMSALWSISVNDGAPIKAKVIWAVLGIILIWSLIAGQWLKKATRLFTLGYVQLFFDVALSTTIIFVTGATFSPFIFLYLLVIVEATVIFGRHGSVIIAALSGLSYALLASGLLPQFDNEAGVVSGPHILGVYTALIVIALLSSYFARQLEIAAFVADRYAKDLHELSNQQKQLFEELSEGVVTLDLDWLITDMNQAACNIFGLRKYDVDNLVGTPLESLFAQYGVLDTDDILRHGWRPQGGSEIILKKPGSSSEIRLRVSARPLTDSAGNEVGMVVTLSDISHVRSMEELLSVHEKMTKLLAHSANPPLISASVRPIQMIGEGQIMRQIFALVDRVAASDASVLISGESGTGKELIARAVHARGMRAEKPFVAINCGAIPENLIESELFGHKRGSFTGAVQDNPGLFRQANGGTLFLDEVGELPLQLQTKLLRVLQEKSVRPVGGVNDLPIDVRVIAATNRELKQEIKAERFREDLYYRLNVVNIMLPPLRSRREDIPHLVRLFIGQFATPNQVLPQVSPEALQFLMSYSFPGNVRELENIIERAIVLGGAAILPEHLPDEVLTWNKEMAASHSSTPRNTDIVILPIDLEGELSKIEQEYLLRALSHSGGGKKQAAQLLGLNFRSFRYRLKKYGMGEAGDGEES